VADERIEIEIVLDDGSIRKGFAKVAKAGDKTAKKIGDSFDRGLRDIGTRFVALGAAFASVQGITKAINDFKDFERELVKVGKTADIAGQDLIELGNAVTDLSKTLPISQNELLGLATVAGQFGIKGTQDILKFTETLGKLQFATDIIGDEGARSISVLLGVTGEAAGEVDKLGSVLVRLGNNVRATESQILEVSTEVAKLAGVFGVSSADSVAFGATLKALGVEAAAGGTAIGTAFIEINKAIATGSNNLDVFARLTGQSVGELKKLFEDDAAEAVNLFLRGLSRVEKSKVPIVLEQLNLGSKRVAKSLLPLINNYQELATNLRLADDELIKNNALNIESKRAFETVDAQIIIFNNTVRDFSKNLGEFLVPVFLDLIGVLKDAARFWSDFFQLVNNTSIESKIQNVTTEIKDLGNEITILEGKLTRQPGGFLGKFLSKGIREEIATSKNLLTGLEGELLGLLEQQRLIVENAKPFDPLATNIKTVATTITDVTKKVTKDFNKEFGGAIASGVSNFVNAIRKGENAFEAFGKAVLGVFGDLAIQIGTFFIIEGVAVEALKKIDGSGALAAGLALVALGTVLKGIAAGAGGGETTAAGDAAIQEETSIDADEDVERSTSVTVNVEGTVLDPVSVGTQIAELLSDVTDSNDIAVNV
jgi:TP901 family phage tail tape measure protein